MVVWEDGQMKKSDYRKFIIKGVTGVDDFASMREVVTRRYRRVLEAQSAATGEAVAAPAGTEKQKMPSLVLIDGGIGQLHSAAQALESLGIVNQPLASIAKREEIIYVQGQEDDPIVLDRHSPVLHLVQLVRDEAHRFAVTFHRKRREIRDRKTELLEIPGVGERTTQASAAAFWQFAGGEGGRCGGAGIGGEPSASRRDSATFSRRRIARWKRLKLQGRNKFEVERWMWVEIQESACLFFVCASCLAGVGRGLWLRPPAGHGTA